RRLSVVPCAQRLSDMPPNAGFDDDETQPGIRTLPHAREWLQRRPAERAGERCEHARRALARRHAGRDDRAWTRTSVGGGVAARWAFPRHRTPGAIALRRCERRAVAAD